MSKDLDEWAKKYGKPKTAKDPSRIVKEKEFGPQISIRDERNINHLRREQEIVDALDELESMRALAPMILKLNSKKMSVEQALREVSPGALTMLLKLGFSDKVSHKVQADVLKHMLALAGHSVTQKHEFGRLDPDTSKAAMLSLIAGSADELAKDGVEIVDDRGESEKPDDTSDDDEGFET